MNRVPIESPSAFGSRARRAALFVAVAALLVHLGLFAGGVWTFDALNYDDPQVLAIARDVSAADLVTDTWWYAYKPAYFLSLKVDTLFGDGVAAAHVHNLLLHALATFLLVLLLHGLLRNAWAAAAAGLLFAVHPVHVESVAWISGRKDVLSLVFVLGAHLLYRRGRERGGVSLAAPLLLLFGGLTKGTVWIWPGLLLVDEWIEWRRAASGGASGADAGADARAALLRRWVPCALVGVAGVLLDGFVAVASGAGAVEHGASLGALVAAMLGVYAGYLRHLVAPFGLSLDYAVDPAGSWGTVAPWLGLGLLAASIAVLVISWRRRWVPGVAGASLWLLGLAPVNNLWPRTTTLMADRYLYVPAIGAYVIVAALAARGRIARAALGVAVAALVIATLVRTSAFKDSNAVWADAIDAAPHSALARVQAGQAAVGTRLDGRRVPLEDWEAAVAHARAGIRLARRPEIEVKARLLHTGALLGRMGAREAEGQAATEAELRELLEEANAASAYALALPGLPGVRMEAREIQAEAEVLRGQALERWRDLASALAAYEHAIQLWPDNAEAHYDYATLLALTGDTRELDEAEHHLRTALRLRPVFLEASLQLGTVLGLQMRLPESLAVLERAGDRHGRRPEILFTMAQVHLSAGRDVAKAEELLRELQRMHGEHVRAARLLGDIHLAHARILLEAGRDERSRPKLRDALARYEKAARAHPERWEAHVGAGDAHLELGEYREARASYREAARVSPDLLWVGHLMARAAMLEAAWWARSADSDTTRREAARIAALGLEVDTHVIDLGLLALSEEIVAFRPIARAFGPETTADAPEARVLRALALAVTGDEQGARRELQFVAAARGEEAASEETLAAAIFLRGMLRDRAGEIEGARRDYALVAERRPDDPLPRLRGLQLHLREAHAGLRVAGNEVEARAAALSRIDTRAGAIRDFADAHPEFLSAGLLAVEAEMYLGRWVEALRRLNDLKERHPARAAVYRGQSAVYVSQYLGTRERRALKLAARMLRIAMTLDPRDPRVSLDAAHVARIAGDLPRALEHADRARAAELVPGGPAARMLCDLHVALGRQALEKGDATAAMRAVEAALKANRGAGSPWTLKGDVLLRAKKYDEAFEAYRTALELEPASQNARGGMAGVHRERALIYRLAGARVRVPGEASEAVRARAEAEREGWRHRELKRGLEAALRLDPGHEDADEVRDRIRDLRDLDPAVQRQAYLQANEEVTAGRAHVREGRLADGLAAFERAIDLFPNHIPAHVLLAGTAYDLIRAPGGSASEAEQRLEARYINQAFHSLQAADVLDGRNLFPDRHRFRGLLDSLLFERTREPAFRLAAERAYEAYLSAREAAGDAEDDPGVRDVQRRLRALRAAGDGEGD